jgi:magnesium-protoporphyrin IX monomethyl ester (oxidative) cyclase
MRSDPKLLSGLNKLWIRFFLLSVYATMYVRDHRRPVFHAALGVDPTDYDYKVFRICSEITRQVFPLEIDIDAPGFRAAMEDLRVAADDIEEARAKGGLLGGVKRLAATARCGLAFARLYLTPVKDNALPATTRLQPAW